MKSSKGAISLIVLGSILILGPLWGVIGSVIGMIHAFGALAKSAPATPEQLASDISVSLWSTVAGFVMLPIGLALLIGLLCMVTVMPTIAGPELTGTPEELTEHLRAIPGQVTLSARLFMPELVTYRASYAVDETNWTHTERLLEELLKKEE